MSQFVPDSSIITPFQQYQALLLQPEIAATYFEIRNKISELDKIKDAETITELSEALAKFIKRHGLRNTPTTDKSAAKWKEAVRIFREEGIETIPRDPKTYEIGLPDLLKLWIKQPLRALEYEKLLDQRDYDEIKLFRSIHGFTQRTAMGSNNEEDMLAEIARWRRVQTEKERNGLL